MCFLALGDSYTIGEGVPEAGRWPNQLAARLRAQGVDCAEPRIIATTGWTTDELGAAMDAAALEPPYDLVSLLIGVNNQYRGRALDNYRAEFRDLLQRAIGLAARGAGGVIVVSIPDWGVTPFAQAQGKSAADIGHAIDAFNAIARAEAQAMGAAWVDVTAVSRGAGRSLLVQDDLHPSAAQYALWVECILPVAQERCGSGTGSPGSAA